MKEEFIAFIWKNKLFNNTLESIEGKEIEIVHPGYQNFDAGPDFREARVRIGETLWVGNIEIHTTTQDFIRHQHHLDYNYRNLILHVVWNHDTRTQLPFETLQIKDKVDEELVKQYLIFFKNTQTIKCGKHLSKIDNVLINNFTERKFIERIHRKSTLLEAYNSFTQNIHEAIFIHFISCFGYKINSLPFELLAKQLPLAIVSKYSNNLQTLITLFLGVSGFLEANKNNYPSAKKLFEEFEFYRKKHQLEVLALDLFKKFKTRPYNFPVIRLIQSACLLFKVKNPSVLLTNDDFLHYEGINQSFLPTLIHNLIEEMGYQKYIDWRKDAINTWKINFLGPALIFYSQHSGNEEIQEKAINLYEYLNAENNKIIAEFEAFGLKVNNAWQTQGLIETYNMFCLKEKCLLCSIGSKVFYKKYDVE
jgi:hypothetical protein